MSGGARDGLTPIRIVEALDRYVVGQMEAKKAVAIAIRNRLRRQKLGEDERRDILPKNLILIGPTGVGKTEIARRIADLVEAPFVKVEATKFTEVGYVGRDVESMVRDLVEAAVNLVRAEQRREVERKTAKRVEERLLDALLPGTSGEDGGAAATREKLRAMLAEGKLEEREVEVTVEQRAAPGVEVFGPQGVEHMGFDFQNLFEKIMPARRKERRMTVREARKSLEDEEAERLLDREKLHREAVRRAETTGVIFLDELDKICAAEGARTSGPDVSREGVQRDLLPIVEGSTVTTRYGQVRTDHVLFIAAGAFHASKPSDLIPELQGRFPIRVELQPLGREDFLRILREPKNALTRQYAALLAADGVEVEFADEALEEIARLAAEVNQRTQNIGARRLHTMFEKLLEDPLFDAPDRLSGKVVVDRAYVERKLSKLAGDEDLSKYIL